jgi:hypothetical protein
MTQGDRTSFDFWAGRSTYYVARAHKIHASSYLIAALLVNSDLILTSLSVPSIYSHCWAPTTEFRPSVGEISERHDVAYLVLE